MKLVRMENIYEALKNNQSIPKRPIPPEMPSYSSPSDAYYSPPSDGNPYSAHEGQNDPYTPSSGSQCDSYSPPVGPQTRFQSVPRTGSYGLVTIILHLLAKEQVGCINEV